MERGVSLAMERFGPTWLRQYHPTPHVSTTLARIRDCRTEVMGGREMVCPECGSVHTLWNSCRDRHCPNCQGRNREAWLAARLEELLPVVYFHVVFTLPDNVLNSSMMWHRKEAYGALFAAAWKTLKAFADRAGIKMGMTAILHTWGSGLDYHVHLHCIVPAGGIDLKTGEWRNLPYITDTGSGHPFLFPVKAMSVVFRAKFMKEYTSRVKITKGVRGKCFGQDWNVYSKSPVCGPEKTLDYLARYAYRVAIGNNRIREISDSHVTFSYKDYRDGDKVKTMRLKGVEFVRRFSLHVLPPGFVRIRHYGILAPGNRDELRELQKVMEVPPVPKPRKRKNWSEICLDRGQVMNLCPFCRTGVMRIIRCFPHIRSPERAAV